MTLLDLMEAPQKLSRTAQLAAFFQQHPNEWVNCLRLEFAGRMAWRTRLSNCRQAPFNMTIENRQYKRGDITVSEYRYVPEANQ